MNATRKVVLFVMGAVTALALFAATTGMADRVWGVLTVEGKSTGVPLPVDPAPRTSITNVAEWCVTNAAGGSTASALPTGCKWYKLINRGPNNGTCTFDGQTPVLGTTGFRYAGLGTSVTDLAVEGPGWLPCTAATYTPDGGSAMTPPPPRCIVATAAQSTGGCFALLSLQ
jgi:hypothetical protein